MGKSESSKSSSKKLTETTANDQFGNLFLGKSQGKPVDLGAKKLDMNFDADDFFNQFDPAAVKKEVKKPVEEIIPKKSESSVPDTMIKFGGNTPVVEQKPKSNLEEYNSKKQQYNQKLSSTDDDDVQKRYEALVKSGATAIGSEMLFGEEEKPKDTGSAGRWSTPASL